MDLDVDHLQKQIPYYLTAQDQTALVTELRAFKLGEATRYFLDPRSDPFKGEVLQGDGWTNFQLFGFESGNRISVKAIVLSNSCDISPDNKRDMPVQVVFAPIIKLSALKTVLEREGVEPSTVNAKIDAIKAQRLTSLFFLPANGNDLTEDCVVRLDDIHSMPLQAHTSGQKLFTLSMVGFYLFVLKLSVHFCRMQENVKRSHPSPAA